MSRVKFESVVPVPRKKLFQFLFQADYWERGLPQSLRAEAIEKGEVREGSELKWRVSRYGFTASWNFRVEAIIPEASVTLVQTLGFFESWVHEQRLSDHGEHQCLLIDLIEYEMPLGLLGRLGDDLVFRRDLTQLLSDRHERIRKSL